ncbi:MAG: hypothetical protein LC657_04705 [Desulfobacteraceae bacterium]|nr:hypothetical protein [Desulfobacteraceae bacterium]
MRHLTTISLFFILLCLLVPSALLSSPPEPESKLTTPLEDTLNDYLEQGYEVLLGPVQYLGKTDTSISLYRHPPIAYTKIDAINQFGEAWFVRDKDFVYVLSRKGHVVLIRMHEENKDEI